jgi:hypothetical protein
LTISLSVDYVATANIGQWFQIDPRVVNRQYIGIRRGIDHRRRRGHCPRDRHLSGVGLTDRFFPLTATMVPPHR